VQRDEPMAISVFVLLRNFVVFELNAVSAWECGGCQKRSDNSKENAAHGSSARRHEDHKEHEDH
jgi:hypothetical protein